MALDKTLTIINTGIIAAALVTGLISIVKSKERSILVFVSTVIGLVFLIGVTVEMLGWAK